jgi:hypothetical protein
MQGTLETAEPLHQKIILETAPHAATSPHARVINKNRLEDFETPWYSALQPSTKRFSSAMSTLAIH